MGNTTYQRVVKGGSRSRFTENKTVLSQFTKNKIGISRFTEKRENVFLQSKALFVVFTIRPLRVLRDAKRKPSFSFCISQLASSFLKDFEISGCGLKRKTRLLLVNQFFLLPSVKKKKNLLTQSRLVKPCKLVFLVDDLGHLGHPVKALLPLWSK